MYFFCKQKTAYEMRISDWSSDGCSSDLATPHPGMKTTDDSGQTVQRVKVAMTGLALVLLLIGVASVIFSSASSDTPADLAGPVQSDLVATLSLPNDAQAAATAPRSAERRSGKRWFCTLHSRGSPSYQ